MIVPEARAAHELLTAVAWFLAGFDPDVSLPHVVGCSDGATDPLRAAWSRATDSFAMWYVLVHGQHVFGLTDGRMAEIERLVQRARAVDGEAGACAALRAAFTPPDLATMLARDRLR